MRRVTLAAVLLFGLVAIPFQLHAALTARAQLFPNQPASEPKPGAPSERVMVDAILYINPPDDEGLCMGMEPGQVTIVVRRITEAVVEKRPARFGLYGFMVDPDTRIEFPVSNQDVTTSTHVNGSNRYCWSVAIDAPETATMSMAQRGGYVQTIGVRITHRPD